MTDPHRHLQYCNCACGCKDQVDDDVAYLCVCDQPQRNEGVPCIACEAGHHHVDGD